MNTPRLKEFQDQVSELLLRHRSLLDVLSKYNQSNASVHRSIVKSVTECGCIEVHAKKQVYTEQSDLQRTMEQLESHLSGKLCDHCMEIVSAELGKNLFYMSALCNLLHIDLENVVEDESQRCSTLGIFNLS
jgi:NTP pyrophosphatase (non-canonical NTP hydrolase)